MQYNININQFSIIKNKLGINLTEAAILSYIKDFYGTGKILKIDIEGEQYFWIQYQHLLDEMPLLEINSKAVLGVKMKKLVNCGLLKSKLINGNSTYFAFGENYLKYISSTIEDPLIETEGGNVKTLGGYGFDIRGVNVKTLGINNNTNNHNTISLSSSLSLSEKNDKREIISEESEEVQGGLTKEKILAKYSTILSNKIEPKSKPDIIKLILGFYITLRNNSPRDLAYYYKQIEKSLKTGIDYRDLLKAMWICKHNKFASGEKTWKGGWDMNYILKPGKIDVAMRWEKEQDKIPSAKELELLNSCSYLFTINEIEAGNNGNVKGKTIDELREESLENMETDPLYQMPEGGYTLENCKHLFKD